ncbi:DUF2786 domain-containing protein [Parafrankia sp. EUN1f]|uniref:DUF2786 domain-containing protein n=1 Tax=Parafrankia sp. EUN1f TaxID=102897 RepID=UPI0001C4526C|nr:DUF2786 domain-containing protein [Parafrankia sp. EUN1f]EFC79145.1 hypothetical protein FrEUN1fDRAFT_7740 [Parafrankia sp. EUN1f]
MNPDAALTRIRKLLAMAEDDAITTEARETYNRKAAELIARYGIDQARLDATAEQPAAAADMTIRIDRPYIADKIGLLASIADPLGCRIVQRTRDHNGNRVTEGHLFGMTADLERTQILYTSLLIQSTHSLATTPIPAGDDTRAFRRSWLTGFAAAVSHRLTAAENAVRRDAQAEDSATGGPSTALVLASRADRVQEHLANTYPKLRTTRRRRLTGTGGRSGYRAGERADLGTTRLSPTAQPAIRS